MNVPVLTKGVGDIVMGHFPVPMNPVGIGPSLTPMIAPGLGDIGPGGFTVPMNPVGGLGGCNCSGGGCGCGGVMSAIDWNDQPNSSITDRQQNMAAMYNRWQTWPPALQMRDRYNRGMGDWTTSLPTFMQGDFAFGSTSVPKYLVYGGGAVAALMLFTGGKRRR